MASKGGDAPNVAIDGLRGVVADAEIFDHPTTKLSHERLLSASSFGQYVGAVKQKDAHLPQSRQSEGATAQRFSSTAWRPNHR